MARSMLSPPTQPARRAGTAAVLGLAALVALGACGSSGGGSSDAAGGGGSTTTGASVTSTTSSTTTSPTTTASTSTTTATPASTTTSAPSTSTTTEPSNPAQMRLARVHYEQAGCVSAAYQSQALRLSARHLEAADAAGGPHLTQAYNTLIQLASLPETGDTPAQQTDGQRWTDYLNDYFGVVLGHSACPLGSKP